jgi:PAS domain S-box-containing protein
MGQTRLSTPELIVRTRWYINLRWFVLLAITVPGLISLYVGSGASAEFKSDALLAAVALGINVVFYALTKPKRGDLYYRILAATILTFDVLFISFFIFSKGGIESRSPVLYTLPIMISGALFGRRAVYATALSAAFVYDLLVTADYFSIIHSIGGLTGMRNNLPYVINSTVFFTAILVTIGFLTDFTTRLLISQERQASASAAALKRAQMIAKVGSWEWDIATNNIMWSDELLRIFGLSRRAANLTYDDYLKLIHPLDRQRVAATIHKAVKNHRPFSFDHRVTRPRGQEIVVHSEGQVATDRRGHVVQLYGTARDITAERSLEEAKGDFVALASHQLRTPASGVRMILALLRDGYMGKLKPEQQASVEQAFEANQRLLRIADDLLNVAKLESGRLKLNPRQLELGNWLKTLLVNQKLLAKERRQKLRLIIPKNLVYVSADPERLAMALDNLLGNARKYTPRGGRITVTLEAGKVTNRIIVSDTGGGMTKQELGKLFGKFTRLDNEVSRGVEGTGLGLYLAKSIIDLHKGSIKVTSKPGLGTSFTIYLPRYKVPRLPRPRPPRRAAAVR